MKTYVAIAALWTIALEMMLLNIVLLLHFGGVI